MMSDYEQHHYDKDLLKNSAVNLGTLDVPVTDLEQVRVLVNKYCEEQPDSPKLSPDWCFIDCKLYKSRYFTEPYKCCFASLPGSLHSGALLPGGPGAGKPALHHRHRHRLYLRVGPGVSHVAADAGRRKRRIAADEGRLGPAGASHQQRGVQRSGVPRWDASVAWAEILQPIAVGTGLRKCIRYAVTRP